MLLERRFSIHRRMLLGALVLILLLGAVAIQAILKYGKRAANLSYDRLLTSAAIQLADAIRVEQGQVVLNVPRSLFETLGPTDRILYRISELDGTYLTGQENLPLPSVDPSQTSKPRGWIYTSQFEGDPTRFVFLRHSMNDPEGPAEVGLLLGQSLESRKALAEEISFKVLRLLGLTMLGIIGLAWYGINVALRPLGTFGHVLSQRSTVDFSPITLANPVEIVPMQEAINHYLGRLKETLDRMQRYTHDAAEQIRTPLASLKAVAQNIRDGVSPEERERQLQQLLDTVDELNCKVSQVLTQANIAHRFQSEAVRPVDLAALLKQICLESANDALNRQVELALIGGDQPLHTLGNEYALTQLFRNLVENAVAYAVPGTSVEVALSQHGGFLEVEVRDQGPGIAEDEKLQVFERFYRGPQPQGAGSGLGLAIAQDVAARHGAWIELLDNEPRGLIARVRFPMSARGKWSHPEAT